jgi:amino acid transporter
MKGGTLYFGIVTVFVLLVVGIAMYVSGGFQMLQENFGSMGVVGFVVVFVLVAVGFMASVRRSLKRAMERGGQTSVSEELDG